MSYCYIITTNLELKKKKTFYIAIIISQLDSFPLNHAASAHTHTYVEYICEDQDEADGHTDVCDGGEHGHVPQVPDEGQHDDEGKEEDHVEPQIQPRSRRNVWGDGALL